MADIRKLLETKRNGLRVNLFEFDIDDEENFNHIKTYLINKVKKSKIHNIEEYDLTYYGAKNLNPAFVAKFNAQAAKINIPKKTSIRQFDVRRERVTEWMAQYLLEQMYGCTFYEEADKRVNLKTVEADKHTDGIDVPGIWIDNDRVRFVICEVKASQEKKIPYSSVGPLQDDLLQRVIDFLARLIAGEKKDLADNLMFFPFLLRNNGKIIDEQNIDDYRNFSLQRVRKKNVENIIAAFGNR